MSCGEALVNNACGRLLYQIRTQKGLGEECSFFSFSGDLVPLLPEL
jgi:hypothetical protein